MPATGNHKHDIYQYSSLILDGPLNYNVSHERAINTGANQGGGGAYKSMFGLIASRLYQPRNSTGYYMAILDIFYLARYGTWVYGPSGYETNYMGYWVAWSMFDTQSQSFAGPYCGPGTSNRLRFGVYPLYVFVEFMSSFLDYDITSGAKITPLSWSGAPTPVFSTTALAYKSTVSGVTTLTPSGSIITLKTGLTSTSYTMGGKPLRFHGFLSYSGNFSSTTYAFTSLNNASSLSHTFPKSSYGNTPAYPTRPTTTITHRAISLCTILNSGTVKIPNLYSPGGVVTASAASAFPNQSAIPINTIRSTASSEGYSNRTDVNTSNYIAVPDWMTEEIFLTGSGNLYAEGDNPALADSGYYGTTTGNLVLAYWDNVTREWSQYQAYSLATGYLTWTVSDMLAPIGSGNPRDLCVLIDGVRYGRTVYTSDNIGPTVQLYDNTGLSVPSNFTAGYYAFADGQGNPVVPTAIYTIMGNLINDVTPC